MQQKVVPFLTFSSGAREAAEFHVSVFPDGKLLPGNRPGVSFEVGGQRFDASDGGPTFAFSKGTSFHVRCETQAEVDHYWERLRKLDIAALEAAADGRAAREEGR